MSIDDLIANYNRQPLEAGKTWQELARIADCQEYLYYPRKATRRGLIALRVLAYLRSVAEKEIELETRIFALNCPKLI